VVSNPRISKGPAGYRDGAMTHSTSDDASTAALLLTCLARRAIRSAGLRRVFACQTATKRYHTWHAASSWDCRYQRDEAMTLHIR